MAKSLQDQLLSAGLINHAKAKTIKTNKRKQTTTQRKNNIVTEDKIQQRLKQTKIEQTEKDRLLNLQKQQQAEKKAITAQIKQLIDLKKIPQEKEGEAYNFSDGSKVKKIYINAEIRMQIANGRLAIVKIENRYEIVTAGVAHKILQRDKQCVLLLNDHKACGDNKLDKKDAYADYQVPDDLMW